jgi:hypothetical protein
LSEIRVGVRSMEEIQYSGDLKKLEYSKINAVVHIGEPALLVLHDFQDSALLEEDIYEVQNFHLCCSLGIAIIGCRGIQNHPCSL